MQPTLALIGFGEAGQTFARAGGWGGAAHVYDIQTDDPARAAGIYAAYARAGVAGHDDAAAALAGQDLVLSLVTADSALRAALADAPLLAPGALWCDMNSVAPQTKRAAAQAIEAAGGRYADVAVMAPVDSVALDVPLLVSGPHAGAAEAALRSLGFGKVRIVGDQIGRASTIKMLRSVMYKGVEALTAECLLACERAGVTDEVLASFGNDWSSGADYRLDRMMMHGLRRAAEMREVARTLEGLGIEPLMTRGTAARQQDLGARAISPVPDGLEAKLERLKA